MKRNLVVLCLLVTALVFAGSGAARSVCVGVSGGAGICEDAPVPGLVPSDGGCVSVDAMEVCASERFCFYAPGHLVCWHTTVCISWDNHGICVPLPEALGTQACGGYGVYRRCVSTSELAAPHQVCVRTDDTLPACVKVEP